MGSLKQVYSFILLSARVEVDSSLVSERICDVNAALENSFTFCMTAVKTFTGITIAQSLHDDFVISIGSPSWFNPEGTAVSPAIPTRFFLRPVQKTLKILRRFWSYR